MFPRIRLRTLSLVLFVGISVVISCGISVRVLISRFVILLVLGPSSFRAGRPCWLLSKGFQIYPRIE